VSSLFEVLRRHAVAFLALFLLLGGAAAAVTVQATSSAASNRIYACVAGDEHELQLTTAKASCPPGQTKISWNAAGRRGSRGPAGAAGNNGARGIAGVAGKNGAQGAAGATGPAGVAGANGLAGAMGATGRAGADGANGLPGAIGPTGRAGLDGATGPAGLDGATGPAGVDGVNGSTGAAGTNGVTGPRGATGSTGDQGATGPAGALAAAEFYALMPPDNTATVGAGAAVSFPQDGPATGATIARTGPRAFQLSDIGIYRVSFSVPANEPGQLVLTLNGFELHYTVVGRATGTTMISGEALVQTTLINSVLTVENPIGNPSALTITPLAGGPRPVAATLTIQQLQ
jgi:hypothetical protein